MLEQTKHKSIHFILVQNDLGASLPGARKGPKAVHQSLIEISPVIRDFRLTTLSSPEEITHIEQTNHAHNMIAILNLMKDLQNHVSQNIEEKSFPIVLSGDHSTATGTIAGLKSAFPDQRIGIVWFDAHTDIHSPFTSHSGNMHGMPLAGATNQDNLGLQRNTLTDLEFQLWKEIQNMSGVKPMVDIKDIVFIGARDMQTEEKTLVQNQGCLMLDKDDLEIETANNLYQKITKQLDHCDLIYVSFDIDYMDGSLVPGTGARVENGPDAKKTIELVSLLATWNKVICFEMSEVNPELDQDGQTATLAAKIIHKFL
jgi:arginase